MRLDNAVERALMAAKTKNPKLAKAALDMSLIKLDGDAILGLNEQLEKLKASDGYLFEDSKSGDDDPNKSSFRVNSSGEHKPGAIRNMTRCLMKSITKPSWNLKNKFKSKGE